MRIKRGKTYTVRAKQDVTLEGKSGQVYDFKKDEKYKARFFILNIAQIGIDSTKVTVNTSWIADNFVVEQ